MDSGRRTLPSAAPVGASIGALLRERREALGATLAEVEAATKIRQKYLSALEADEWQALPGEVVGRGFLRNYAGYLGLEATEIIERRRAVADPSLSGALAPTSAGSALPPPRAVDYRPKDVDLREEPDTLEERTPPRLGPLLGIVAVVAVLLGLWWGISRFGGNALDGITTAGAGLTDRVAGLFASNDATATPALGVLADGSATRAEAISTSVFGETTAAAGAAAAGADAVATGGSGFDSSTGGADAGGSAPAALPPSDPTATIAATPTPTVEPPTPTPTLEPPTATPTPAVQTVAVTTQANLRSGPSTDATIAGAAQVGVNVNLVGRSADGLWYLLDNGAWIFAELVAAPALPLAVADPNAPPAPIAADPAAAAPTADPAAGGFELPTATPAPAAPVEPPTPAPAVAAAACADPRSVISSPGQGQTVAGVVSIVGTATHENFASYKLEAGAPGSSLAFIGSGNTVIQGGSLGTLDSFSFGNGPLVVRLTVIDQTGNFPPPCEVTVTVAN
jgi:cytoskeletal protein RodZ